MQDYETFFDAKEDNSVHAFLGLPPPPGSKVGTVLSFLFLWKTDKEKEIQFSALPVFRTYCKNTQIYFYM